MKTDSQISFSIYIPKYQRWFMSQVEAWQKETYPEVSFSDFVLVCIKDKINRLNPEETQRFQEIAQKLIKELNSKNKGDRSGKTKA